MKKRFQLSMARTFSAAKLQTRKDQVAPGMNLLKAHRKRESLEAAGMGGQPPARQLLMNSSNRAGTSL